MSVIFRLPMRLPGSAMKGKLRLPTGLECETLAQMLIGLFFLAASYHKAMQGFFGSHRVALSYIFEHWLKNGLPVSWYGELMRLSLPYTDVLAVIVILCQATIGILLILNYRTQLAGFLMFFVQGNIYLATYHHAELRVFGSQTLWMSVFFMARPVMTGKMWVTMTYLVTLTGLLHLYARFLFGDATFAAVDWQRTHYIENVMSSHIAFKNFFIVLTDGGVGKVIWAGAWWVKLLLCFGILTRYRLTFGALWLLQFFMIAVVWLSAWNCEGVFWVLFLLLWLTHEYRLQSDGYSERTSLLP